ncbi:unnamed protein product [Schistosoma margrebowiei]|uniref:Uncharacterized protein n=1 Tax=Schistosoma margrebowiei TaxID=48269 RepID=A0A183MJ19_9TREM|nr:unnamed protein product [Schistosoma margrebowiei]
MVVGNSRQETLDSGFVLLGTRQQVPVILRKLVLPGGFDLVSPVDYLQPPSNLSFCIIIFLYSKLRVSIKDANMPKGIGQLNSITSAG